MDDAVYSLRRGAGVFGVGSADMTAREVVLAWAASPGFAAAHDGTAPYLCC
jgi:hypothetical protein